MTEKVDGQKAMETLARGIIKVAYDSGALGFKAEILDPKGYRWKFVIKRDSDKYSTEVKPRGWNTPRGAR